MNRGFTLVELMVSVAIFAIMTGLVVAKYGNFNQSVLLTNLAYDVALTIRTAQTYGLSVSQVKTSESDTSTNPNTFRYVYGSNFTTSTGIDSATGNRLNAQTILYASPVGALESYQSGDTVITKYSIKRNATITGLCVGSSSGSCGNVSQLDVAFKRPDPNAIICGNNSCGYQYARITIEGNDSNSTTDRRQVEIYANGQISVLD